MTAYPHSAATGASPDRSILDLRTLLPMREFFVQIYETIVVLSADANHAPVLKHRIPWRRYLQGVPIASRWSPEELRRIRRYINTDLESYSIEFYLQRQDWANTCAAEFRRTGGQVPRCPDALAQPARHPCMMKAGFLRTVLAAQGNAGYSYEDFLRESGDVFQAIHSHLTAINRSLSYLYNYVTQLPFSQFTPAGKREIRHLTEELYRIMLGVLASTHLHPQEPGQSDLVNYLVSVRSDCDRMLGTIPLYFQNHRLRLVHDLWPSGPGEAASQDRATGSSSPMDISILAAARCVPDCAGPYRDFLSAYENLTHHARAIIHWALRLMDRWYHLPPHYGDFLAPSHLY